MAKASLDSSRRFTPAPSTMPAVAWPHTCGKASCAHDVCAKVARQAALPCCSCDRRIPGGRVVYVFGRSQDGFVTRQMCGGCMDEQRERGQMQADA